MMKMTGKAFAKKLFGTKYERLPRTLLICIIVFWGLYIAGFQVQIAPSVRILMVSAFTAGVMWQALSSKDNADELGHMLMLPHHSRGFVFSYVAMLGAYAVFTKTGLLLVVLLAVSVWKTIEIIGIVICMLHAILMAAAVYSLRKYWYMGIFWTAVMVTVVVLFGGMSWISLMLLANGMFAVLFLWRADGYAFYIRGKFYELPSDIKTLRENAHANAEEMYRLKATRLRRRISQREILFQWESKKSYAIRQKKRASLWRYFFRYLTCHKNYLLNTAVMWCVALVMPYFLKEIAGLSVVPIGFAVLSLNTPICILLSCDRDLEQAVRFLPGQKRRFCIPYCLFIFQCNMMSDAIFLISWQAQNGGITVLLAFGAVFFALQSAALSVLLEWFYPIRNWKIESDLWHHPRKYMVPAVMLLLAGAVSAWPLLLYALLLLPAVETIVFIYICWRYPEP
ncbi:hypothetical protein AALA98_11310 [Lachnospiraceae bacterium 45-W7]